MDDIISDAEIRKQKAEHRLGGAGEGCALCLEDDPLCMELHHVAGRKFHDQTVRHCSNCHRKLSAAQRDHPPGLSDHPNLLERIGHFLLGLADMLALLGPTLRGFGLALIDFARSEMQEAAP